MKLLLTKKYFFFVKRLNFFQAFEYRKCEEKNLTLATNLVCNGMWPLYETLIFLALREARSIFWGSLILSFFTWHFLFPSQCVLTFSFYSFHDQAFNIKFALLESN